MLPEYAVFDRRGLDVGVVGAVTQETSSLVSPGGIATLDFGDPIDAINRVAGEIRGRVQRRGRRDRGEVARRCRTWAPTRLRGRARRRTASSPRWSGPRRRRRRHLQRPHPQGVRLRRARPRPPGTTRPFIQTGEYGANVGQISLTVDPATDDVTAYTQQIVPRTDGRRHHVGRDLPAGRRGQADRRRGDRRCRRHRQPTHGDDHRRHHHRLHAAARSSTACATGGTRDDRASESTLGNLVADALVDGLDAEYGKPDLGIVNPGGLRAELLYAGNTATNPANTDGVVTYAEANAVLPFVNTVALST